MQTKTLIAFLIIFCTLSGCKKKSCDEVVCAGDRICVDGACGYPFEFLGPSITSHFSGHYHLVGQSVSWAGNQADPPVYIDDTFEVLPENRGLLLRGGLFSYSPETSATSAVYHFTLVTSNAHDRGWIEFHKNLDDSLIYSSGYNALGGGSSTTLRGKKIN